MDNPLRNPLFNTLYVDKNGSLWQTTRQYIDTHAVDSAHWRLVAESLTASLMHKCLEEVIL